MKIIKIENDVKNIEVYELKKDDVILGIGVILLENDINQVNIEIKKEYQSNGYGTFLFKEMLKILREKDYKQIELVVRKDNYKIINIINKFNAIHISTNDLYVRYLIPIKNAN